MVKIVLNARAFCAREVDSPSFVCRGQTSLKMHLSVVMEKFWMDAAMSMYG
jgi:hypothetical protein